MSRVMLFLFVCFVSLVFGIYQRRNFIFKGYVENSNRLSALKEILSSTDVDILPQCALECFKLQPQCRAIEICPQREHGLCRICCNTNATFTMKGTELCRHLQLENAETKCSPIVSVFHTCKEILNAETPRTVPSGVYSIHIDGKPRDVWCDMETDGGGWTVIQRRQNGNTDFFRVWNDYKLGFGNASDEYWIGNDALHLMTTTRNVTLRVDLEKFNGTKGYGTYSTFKVDNENNKYKLSIFGYNGNISNCVGWSNGYPFSTRDKDNDPWYADCALYFHGGWWYSQCTSANLNGKFSQNETADLGFKSITCNQWNGLYKSLKGARMMIR